MSEWVSEWVSYCLTPSEQWLSKYHGENKLLARRLWRYPLYSWTCNTPNWIFIVFAQQYTRRSTLTHYPDSMPRRLCSYSLLLRFLRISSKFQFYKFCFIRLLIEPTIYHTWDNPACHYTTETNNHNITIPINIQKYYKPAASKTFTPQDNKQ